MNYSFPNDLSGKKRGIVARCLAALSTLLSRQQVIDVFWIILSSVGITAVFIFRKLSPQWNFINTTLAILSNGYPVGYIPIST